MKTIYVLGSLNTDLTIMCDRLPVEGETVKGSNFRTGCGGKGLNQAIAAAKLGAEVKFLGAVGNDLFGHDMIKALKDQKVDVKHVKVLNDVSSGVAMITLNNHNNRIILSLGANLKITNKDVDEFLKDAKEGDIFLTQLENNLDAIEYGLKVAFEKDLVTVLNPAPATKEIAKSIRFCKYFVPNESEFGLLGETAHEAKNLLITLGKDGYKFISKDKTFSGKAPKVNVVDTTGAGDCFIGALCYMLASEKEINKDTLDLVTKIASISTTRFGSSISSPTMDEVINFK